MAANPKLRQEINKSEEVDRFLNNLEHPLKAEIQAVREIIMNVNPQITEQVKWNAPTFSYKGYILTIHVRAQQHVHLIFHNGAIIEDHSGLMEGSYPDRRMMYFSGMEDVQAKKAALENIIREWVRLMDQA